MSRHSYDLRTDSPDMSSTHLVTMHGYFNTIDYIPYAVLICRCLFVTINVYFLIPLPSSYSPSTPFPLVTVSLFSISMSLFQFCLFVYFVLWVPHISKMIWYLSFFVRLIALSMTPGRSIHVVAGGKISLYFTAE